MSRIFINGMSAKSGGGKSVLRNFLKGLAEAGGDHDYVVAAPRDGGYEDLAVGRIRLIPLDHAYSLPWLLWFSMAGLPRLLRKQRFDLLFNPSDIPTRTKVPQVFLFDWPYAAFPESRAWAMGSLRDRAIRQIKQWLFTGNLGKIEILVAQSDALAERLSALYGHPKIAVVQNAVSFENIGGGEDRVFELSDGINLLCLSAYYSHKNIEIFLPLAKILRDWKLPVHIVTTLNGDQDPAAARFLQEVEYQSLGSVITNVGSVPMHHVPPLYQQTDGLLLPTLLESFSGTYVEAMFHRRPILTSNLSFAVGVCGDAAIYFDPSDPMDIAQKIAWMMNNPAEVTAQVGRGEMRLATMLDWPAATKQLVALFDSLLENAAHPAAI